MRLRTKLGGTVSALLVLPLGAVAVPAGASAISDGSACTVEALPLPSGIDHAEVVTGDPSGRYLLGQDLLGAGATSKFLLWQDGAVSEFPRTPSDKFFHPFDVNESGQVAGSAYRADRERAYLYADGEYTELPAPDGLDHTRAMGINEGGDLVGVGYNLDTEWFEKTPLYWPADQPGTVRTLNGPDPADVDVDARDISDAGAVIGSWDGHLEGKGAYVWADVDSEPRELFGSNGEKGSHPRQINGNWVAGSDTTSGEHGTAGALWNVETDEVAVYKKRLGAVNSDGDIAFGDLGADQIWPAAIIHPDRSVTKLTALYGDRPRQATVVFDRGSDLLAAGYARGEDKTWQPVVWRGC